MSLQKQPPVEMAPGFEWDVYTDDYGTISFPRDSLILDQVVCLPRLLAGQARQPDVLAEYVGHGGEAEVYAVKGCEETLVAKVARPSSMFNHETRALQMARYGGVCVQRVLNGTTVGRSMITTPTYEAVVTAGDFSAVIMSREHKMPLSGRLDDEVARRAVDICRRITSVATDALLQSSMSPGISSLMDIRRQNLLVRHDDGEVDWTELTVIDAMYTHNMFLPPKLWKRQSDGYT